MASSRERFNNIIASENTRRVNARERYEALRVLEHADEELNSAVNFINSGKGNITSGDANADGGTDIRDIVRSKKISAESTEHIDAVNKLRSAYDVLERYAKQQGGGLDGYKEMANGLNEIKEILVGTKQVGEENAKLLTDMISGAYAKRLYREQTEQMFENIDLNSPEIFAKQQQYKQNNPNLYSVMGGRAYNPIPSVNPTQLTKKDLKKVQTAQAWDKARRELIEKKNAAAKTNSETQKKNELSGALGWLQSFANDYAQGEKKQSAALPSYSGRNDIEYIVSAAMSDDEQKALQAAKNRYKDTAYFAKMMGAKAPENKQDNSAKDVMGRINASQKRMNNLFGNYSDDEVKAVNEYARLYAQYTGLAEPEDAFSTLARLTGDFKNNENYQIYEQANRINAIDQSDTEGVLPSVKISQSALMKKKSVIDTYGKISALRSDFENLSPESKENYLRAKNISPLEGEKFIEAHREEIAYNKAVTLYNKAVNGNASQRAAARLDIYLQTGIEIGLEGLSKGIDYAEDLLSGKTPDIDTEYSEYQIANEMVSNYFAENNKTLAKIIQDLAVNIAQNQTVSIGGTVLGLLTGNPIAGSVVGNVMFGVSVFGNTYEQEIRQGTDSGKAAWYALGSAAAETTIGLLLDATPGVGGFLSGKTIADISKNVSNAALKFVLKTAARFTSEALEEGIQQALDPFLRNWILDENNSTILNDASAWKDVGYSAMIGGLSAVLMSSGATISEIQSEQAIAEYGAAYKQFSEQYDLDIKDLAEYGKLISDKKTELYKMAEGLLSGKEKQTDYNVGVLYTETLKTMGDASGLVTATIGNKIKTTENSVDDLLAQYDEAVKNGIQFSDIVTLQADTIREKHASGIEFSVENLGKFAREVYVYAPRAAIESVISQNSELQSTANGGIIENRGDNYVNDVDGRRNASTLGREQETESNIHSGTKSESSGSWGNTKEEFSRRKRKEAQANGTEDRLKISASSNDNIVYAYVSKASDDSEAYRAVKILKSRGYDTYYSDGTIEDLTEKGTKKHNQAVTTPDGKVIVSSNATGPAEQIADHEEVHAAQHLDKDAFIEYQSSVYGNLVFDSDAFLSVAQDINEKHLIIEIKPEDKIEEKLLDVTVLPKILNELLAYLRQAYNFDVEIAKRDFGDIFTDWDEVAAAIEKFNSDVSKATSAEAASSFAQNESVFDEPSAQFPKADFIEDMGAKLAGVERHSEGQRKIIEIGRKLGYRVVFDRDLKTRSGAFANGKIDRKNKVIYINPNSTKAMQFIFKHELAHYLELNFSAYTDFANAVMDSALFKRYVTSRGYKSTAEWNSAIVGEYAEAGFKDFGEADANYEMVADFVGDCLFGKSESLSEQLLKCVPENQRKGFFEKVKEFFAKIRQLFAGNKNVSSEITELEKQFIKAYKAVETNKNTAENGGEKYSVEFQSAIVNTNIKNMIDKIKSGEFKANEKIYFDDIDEEIAQQIEILTGIDVSGFKMAIEARQLEHILKDHGENGKADSSLSDVDNVAKMEYALKSPDDIRLSGKTQAYSYMKDGKNRTADTVLYEKAIGDKSYYVVQAVADTKAKTLYVVTAFIGKSGYKKEAPQLIDAQSPNVTSKDGSAIASNNSISQKDTSVNTYSTQEDESYSIPVLEREEFAPKNSVATSDSTDDLLDRYDRGEISREELISGLTSQKKKAKENPKTIADMTPADASTTPALERRKGESRGDKESKFYGSLLESDIFDERFKAEVENDSFIKKYTSVTNKETLKKAAKELDEGGRSYVETWRRKKADEANLIDTAVGFILMDRYQRVGDYISAIAAAEKVRDFGTASGQQVQIFSIVGRLDPNAMAAYAQKTLNDAYKRMVDVKSLKWANEHAELFKLTEEDIEFIRRRTLQAALLPEGRDKAIKLAEICQRVQDKIPPNMGQSIRAYQRISLLLNPKTVKRNILGNGSMVPVFIVSDWFGAAIDKAVAKKTDVRTTGTFKLKGSGAALKKGMYESWDDFRRGIRTRQEELDRFDVNSGGKNFNEHHAGKFAKQLNAVAKKLNDIDRFTSFMLEAGDRPFFEMWMNNSLNNQLRLNNVEVPTPEMLDIAREEALQRTWQDNNSATKAMSGIKRSFNVIHIPGTDYGFGDFTNKFVKTPTNIGKAMVEFSPIGLAFAGRNARAMKNAIETGQFTPQKQKEYVRSLSNAITGTLLYVLVFSAASAGLITLTGAGDDDDDVSNFERYVAGIPPYSIEIFGTHVTYDWMQPFGAVLATVADFMESRRNDPEGGIGADFVQAIKAGGRVFSEQSFMKSLYDLFSGEDFIDCITAAILSEPAAFIPQFSSQIASFLDKDRRTTYDPHNEFKTAFNKVIARIPGLRKELPEQVNVLGETAENTQYLDPWEAFLAPGNTYPKSSGKVADEVYELYKKTGNKKVIPRVAPKYFSVKGNKIIFTAEEKADFQRRIGGLSSEMLSAFFSSSQYNSLSDETKVDVIEEIYSYALAKAKSEREYDYKLLSAMKGERKNGEPLLTKEMYERLNKEARAYIAEEYFLSNAEMRYSKNTERLIEYYINQAKK